MCSNTHTCPICCTALLPLLTRSIARFPKAKANVSLERALAQEVSTSGNVNQLASLGVAGGDHSSTGHVSPSLFRPTRPPPSSEQLSNAQRQVAAVVRGKRTRSIYKRTRSELERGQLEYQSTILLQSAFRGKTARNERHKQTMAIVIQRRFRKFHALQHWKVLSP